MNANREFEVNDTAWTPSPWERDGVRRFAEKAIFFLSLVSCCLLVPLTPNQQKKHCVILNCALAVQRAAWQWRARWAQ